MGTTLLRASRWWKLTKFLRNELRIEPQGANLVTEAGGGVPAPKQLKNLENNDFGGLGVGVSAPPLGPTACLGPCLGSCAGVIACLGLAYGTPFKGCLW